MTATEKEIRIENMYKEFDKWCEEVNKQLPELSQRIFALRTKKYTGAGFSYALEAKLGKLMQYANDPDWFPFHTSYTKILQAKMICNITLKEVLRSLEQSESSVYE